MEWITEAAKQVPALSVLVAFAVLFLRHMRDTAEANTVALTKLTEAHAERILEIVSSEDATIKQLTAIVSENTKVIGETNALFRLVEQDWRLNTRRNG